MRHRAKASMRMEELACTVSRILASWASVKLTTKQTVNHSLMEELS